MQDWNKNRLKWHAIFSNLISDYWFATKVGGNNAFFVQKSIPVHKLAVWAYIQTNTNNSIVGLNHSANLTDEKSC
jgi:hypothetical protein